MKVSMRVRDMETRMRSEVVFVPCYSVQVGRYVMPGCVLGEEVDYIGSLLGFDFSGKSVGRTSGVAIFRDCVD